ncbi:MAG TPA: efflux RND transporter periplasmic adaptor subunit [Chloroflexota bacterium]|nr:efflux RND transporter periplasmic adaptor subunit [Chloroflexota bacterium]
MKESRPHQTKTIFFFDPIWERSQSRSAKDTKSAKTISPHHQSPITDYRLPITLVTFLLLLVLTGCAAPNRDRRDAASSAEPTPIPTAVVPNKPTYTVQRGDVIYAGSFNGRINPTNEISLAFIQGGQVAEVLVERGETVLEGVTIARLDTSELERELALAQSALDVAQAQLTAVETANAAQQNRAELALALAQLDLDFVISQTGETPTPEQAYQIGRLTILRDLAQLAVDELATAVDPQLSANVQQAQLRVTELETAVANAVLVAPTDGVLVSLNLAPGRGVAAGEPVATLADLEELEVNANLQTTQMSELAEGLPALIFPANRPGESFPGAIRQMPYPYGTRGSADVPPTDSSTRFAFDNPDDARQFQPGDRVRVEVVIEERPDVLWLPPAAVRNFSGRFFVVVQDEVGQSRVDVVLGIEGDGRVEILEGLSEGQVIVGQ